MPHLICTLATLVLLLSVAPPAQGASPTDCTEREANEEPCFSDEVCSSYVQQSAAFDAKQDVDRALVALRTAVKLRPGPLLRLKLSELLLRRDPQEALKQLRQIPTARLCEETALQVRQDLASAEAAVEPAQTSAAPLLSGAPAATPAKTERPLARRWQLWVGVAGAAVAIGLGVGLGVGLWQHATATMNSLSGQFIYPTTTYPVYMP